MISAEYTITDLNQLIYNFAFDYLKKKYVKVSSKNITTGVVTNCTYGVHYVVVDKTIELLQSVGAVGDVLRIVRETSTSEQIVSWNDASILKASDMSLAQLQQLHILEEYSEYMSTASLALDISGQYDAKNSRIVNLPFPQTTTDAVNRGYIDSFIGTLTDAQTSATLAQSWAIGDILSRPEGSSKYWAEQANIITNGDLWLKKDGSRPLDPSYSPTVPQDVATKDYVDTQFNTTVYTTAILDYNGIDTKAQRDRNIEFDASRYTGIGNNIISGRKVSGVSDFTLGLTAGADWIDSRRYDRLANGITLSPRSVNLVYDKNDGTTGSVLAQYPTDMIDNNTVGFWVFNKTTAGANIPNSAVGISSIAVANDLVPTGGITSVDGWCDYASKLDGTSGYYVTQNSTGVPIGNNTREFTLMFTVNNVASRSNVLLTNSSGWQINFDSTGNIGFNNGTNYASGYIVEVGKTYKLKVHLNSGSVSIYVNGILIYVGSITVSTTASNIYVGNYLSGSYFCGVTLHYLEVRNALRTGEQTAQIANKLLLPCFYTSGYLSNTDITTSVTAISSSDYGGYVKANAFDKNASTFWEAGEITANQSGVSYIGNLFGKTVKIEKATIQQYSVTSNCLTSAKLQYTTDNGASWITIGTYALAQNATVQEFSFTPITCNGMRWLANSNLPYEYGWAVQEVTFVTDNTGSIRKNIAEILPANSVSLGMVKVNSAGITAYNDTDYMYGRREGAYGGNRRVFLGWKAFSGAVYFSWDNPFGTRKVKLQAVWAQDANGMNESDLLPHYWTNGDAGGYTGTDVTPSARITVRLFSGAVYLNGVRLTSGYIGVYAEVLE